MNFGGPIDLTPFGSVLSGISVVYWLLALAAVFMALLRPKTKSGKAIATTLVIVLFGAIPARGMWQSYLTYSRLKESMALFEARCKTAGEKISRTVEKVEGVVWMKWRSNEPNRSSQFKMDDPYGHDCGGEYCISQLLRASKGLENDPKKKRPNHVGYSYVETTDPRDGQRYRYSMRLTEQDPQLQSFPRPKIEREPIARLAARYGITWDDVSTDEDREHWIAGGSIKVVDLQNNEVIAERRGYMVDRGQGAGREGSFRSPWGFAAETACPPKVDADGKRTQVGFTLRFGNKVLQPITGE